MSILIAMMVMQAAAPGAHANVRQIPSTVPVVTMEVGGRPVVMDSHARTDGHGMHVEYSLPSVTVPVELKDGTGGVIPMSIPDVSYDQPLVLRNARTGETHTVEGVVQHREPVMVVHGASASARDAYRIGVPKDAAEAGAGVCAEGARNEGKN